MKTMAMPAVNLVKKFPAPLLPKIVALEPPNTAPISAPFPVWSKTTNINPMLTIMWMTVMTITIGASISVQAANDRQKRFCFETGSFD
ncbi:MAG TPA: hypothetical protein VMO00_09945 [Methylomirabilota bacterium]|nr:hypothetical protein [Methylomirabilota bacterium]